MTTARCIALRIVGVGWIVELGDFEAGDPLSPSFARDRQGRRLPQKPMLRSGAVHPEPATLNGRLSGSAHSSASAAIDRALATMRSDAR